MAAYGGGRCKSCSKLIELDFKIGEPTMQKITPFLWFDGKAEEAANFYTSIFRDAKIGQILRSGEAGPGPKGSVITVSFQIAGQGFVALNGNAQFKFNESISFFVDCKDQAEVDHFWTKLIEGGGSEIQCGWLKDKYGVCRQIIPSVLMKLLGDPDSQRSARAMQAMMQMKKIDVAKLQAAADGK